MNWTSVCELVVESFGRGLTCHQADQRSDKEAEAARLLRAGDVRRGARLASSHSSFRRNLPPAMRARGSVKPAP